jgi:hypothetical protein
MVFKIKVRQQQKPEPPEVTSENGSFFQDTKDPSTTTSTSHPTSNEIRAHQSILTARAQYLKVAGTYSIRTKVLFWVLIIIFVHSYVIWYYNVHSIKSIHKNTEQ